MAKQSIVASGARWFGIQIAGKAVSFALGLPIVTGTIMALLAWFQGLPLAWGFFTVTGVMAFTSIFANQTRAFSRAYSVADKFGVEGVRIDWAAHSKTGQRGYLMAVHFKNAADIPLEFAIDRVSASINGRVVEHDPRTTGGEVAPQAPVGYMIGAAPMEPLKNGVLNGEVEVEYAFGRPGKLRHKRYDRFGVTCQTSDSGAVATTTLYAR